MINNIQEAIYKEIKEKEESLLKIVSLKWYKMHNYPRPEEYKTVDNCVRVVNEHCGFIPGREPSYSDIELFDLRYIDTCTMDELFDKYF